MLRKYLLDPDIYESQFKRDTAPTSYNDNSLFADEGSDYPVLLESTDGKSIASARGQGHLFLSGGQVTFSFFRLGITDQYVASVRDRRETTHGTKTIKLRLDYKEIDGTGKSPEEIRQEALAHWDDRYAYLSKFLPLEGRDVVDAMHAAETNSPHPKAAIFQHFPAFMHAYQGQDGFFQALNDIYGPEGNKRALKKVGIRPNWWGEFTEGADIGETYTVTDRDFIQLYEKMGRKDQDNFRAALKQFRETVLINMESFRDTNVTLCIDMAVEHGSGIRETAAYQNFLLEEEARRRIEHRHRKSLNQLGSALTAVPLINNGP